MSEKITAESIFKEYDKMTGFNTGMDLYETVKANENMFIGKQWEGVESNGLPTPVFNFLKRVTLFTVASITSDNLKMKASPLAASGEEGLSRYAEAVNSEFEKLFEFNKIPNKMREVIRNAAVDGDGCTYTYWNPDVNTGGKKKGAIVTEVIENTRVGFGNPNNRDVQIQPYILLKRRELTDKLKKRAKKLGCPSWEDIREDTDDEQIDAYKETGGKTTVILRLWKDEGKVWACEAVKDIIVRKPWDLGLTLYPITWLNWDYIPDSYHGEAMITGLIPNQMFVNKLFAMSMISLMTTAYPRIVYDKTRVPKWDNRVGAAIPITGGDVNGVAKILDPAQISPQIAQFIELAVDMTQSNLGATSVALGDTRPDNTSAIIALQRAAAAPNEITKQNLYQCIEDLGRIYVDFMAEYYGKRIIRVNPPAPTELAPEISEFAAEAMPLDADGKMPVEFDYAVFKKLPMSLKLDVGAASYWSEIANAQTLDNLLLNGKIDTVTYLEHMPDGYISDKQSIINAIRAAQPAAAAPPDGGGGGGGGLTGVPPEALGVRGGGGNGSLQRNLVKEGV